MHVTIIADASYCPKYSVAGYGYWIVCDRGSDGGGGPLGKGGKVESSIVAEMMAVVNSLYKACHSGLVQPQDIVLIQTDCVPALDAFTFKRVKLSTIEQEVVTRLNQLMLQFSLTLRYKHVRGHVQLKEARYITNNICDVRAKTEMRKLRKLAQKPKGNSYESNC